MSPRNKKFLLCPGPMKSKDGDTFQVTAKELVRLYGVDQSECQTYINGKSKFKNFSADLLVLIPRYEHEDYMIEKCFTLGAMMKTPMFKGLGK